MTRQILLTIREVKNIGVFDEICLVRGFNPYIDDVSSIFNDDDFVWVGTYLLPDNYTYKKFDATNQFKEKYESAYMDLLVCT